MRKDSSKRLSVRGGKGNVKKISGEWPWKKSLQKKKEIHSISETQLVYVHAQCSCVYVP